MIPNFIKTFNSPLFKQKNEKVCKAYRKTTSCYSIEGKMLADLFCNLLMKDGKKAKAFNILKNSLLCFKKNLDLDHVLKFPYTTYKTFPLGEIKNKPWYNSSQKSSNLLNNKINFSLKTKNVSEEENVLLPYDLLPAITVLQNQKKNSRHNQELGTQVQQLNFIRLKKEQCHFFFINGLNFFAKKKEWAKNTNPFFKIAVMLPFQVPKLSYFYEKKPLVFCMREQPKIPKIFFFSISAKRKSSFFSTFYKKIFLSLLSKIKKDKGLIFKEFDVYPMLFRNFYKSLSFLEKGLAKYIFKEANKPVVAALNQDKIFFKNLKNKPFKRYICPVDSKTPNCVTDHFDLQKKNQMITFNLNLKRWNYMQKKSLNQVI